MGFPSLTTRKGSLGNGEVCAPYTADRVVFHHLVCPFPYFWVRSILEKPRCVRPECLAYQGEYPP